MHMFCLLDTGIMDDVSRWQLVGMVLLFASTGVQLVGEGVMPWLWMGVIAVGSAVVVLAWRWRLREVWVATSTGEAISTAVSATGPVVVGIIVVGSVLLSFSYPLNFSMFAGGLLAGYFVVFTAEEIAFHRRVQSVAGT